MKSGGLEIVKDREPANEVAVVAQTPDQGPVNLLLRPPFAVEAEPFLFEHVEDGAGVHTRPFSVASHSGSVTCTIPRSFAGECSHWLLASQTFASPSETRIARSVSW